MRMREMQLVGFPYREVNWKEMKREMSLEVYPRRGENWGKKMATWLVGQKSLQGEKMEMNLVERRRREGSSKEMNLEVRYLVVTMMVRSPGSDCSEVQP